MLAGQSLDLGASIGAAVDKAKQSARLLECEAQFPTSANEAEAFAQVVAIKPVPAPTARARREQPDLLVIADRLDVATGCGGKLAARHERFAETGREFGVRA